MTLAPTADHVVDWNALFLQLQREGYSTPDIEHFTGIRRSTFMGWKNGGAQPNHPTGERMIGVGVGTVKKAFTGKGNAKKPEMIAAAQAKGFRVGNDEDDTADALAILSFALKQEAA